MLANLLYYLLSYISLKSWYETHRGLPGGPPVHTQQTRVPTLKHYIYNKLMNQENMHFLLKYQRYNIQRGWNVFMVKIFFNLNYTCGYCLNLDNCTKRLNCRTVKNQQLNESFVNCTRCSHWAQCDDNSCDSSAVSSRGEYSDYTSNEKMYGS